MLRAPVWLAQLSLIILALATPAGAWGQGLPSFAPLNPISTSRSGLYYQPLREPAPGRWVTSMALDYASIIELNEMSEANYVLDS